MRARKWVVGDEYDEVTFARLKQALSDLQYSILTIESETYVGLSIEGLSSLIADLQVQYEQTI